MFMFVSAHGLILDVIDMTRTTKTSADKIRSLKRRLEMIINSSEKVSFPNKTRMVSLITRPFGKGTARVPATNDVV